MSPKRVAGIPSGLRKPADRHHHGNLREALKKQALKMIDANGVARFRLNDAATACGVSPGAPYKHFGGRTEFLAELAEDGFRLQLAALRKARDLAGEDPLNNIIQLGQAFIRFGVREPSRFRLMYGSDAVSHKDYPLLSELDREGFHLLLDAMTAACKQGQVIDGDPRDMALTAFALVYGAVFAFIDGQMGRLGYEPEQAERALQTGTGYLFTGLIPR